MQASARLSSSAASRRVVAGVSGTITRPWHRTWRGKAHAAQLSDQEPPKGQKRMSKDERKFRIEEFVECYKTSNDGKFPSIKLIRQHVGGSHYTVREVLQEVKYNHAKLPLDKSKAAQLQETAECAEKPWPEEDNGSNSFNPQSFEGKQGVDGTLLSQKDSATDTITMEKTGTGRSLELKTTPDSSHYSGETEAAKQVMYTGDTSKNANDSTVLSQKEIEGIKTEASICLGLETKSDPGSHQGETKTNKLHLNNTRKFQNASEPTLSDQTESDKVTKANVLESLDYGRGLVASFSPCDVQFRDFPADGGLLPVRAEIPAIEENPEVEHQVPTKISLLGSLKSLASGIRNFWKKL